MKLKFLLPCATLIIIVLASCKKDNNTNKKDEIESTFALSANEGMSENLTQDANDVLNKAAFDRNLQGGGFVAGVKGTTGTLNCANITVTPLKDSQKPLRSILVLPVAHLTTE